MQNGRCKAPGHGGQSTGRPLSDNPKPETIARRGRTKTYKRLRVLEKVEDARNDPALKSHEENILLLEGLIRAEGEGEMIPPASLWAEADLLYRTAIKSGDLGKMKELGVLLKKGYDSAMRIERILGLMEHQRKHRVSQEKREAQLQSSLDARQVQLVAAQLLAAIAEEVTDPGIRRAIGLRFVRILGSPDC